MLVVEDHHALAVALRHGLIQGKTAAAANALDLASLYLPAQEVARCRRICRLWLYVVDSEEFRRRHHNHCSRTPMPLYLFQDPDRAGLFFLRAVDIQSLVSRQVIRFNLRPHGIHGSCAGILLISFDRMLYACNPCTRRWTYLPHIHVDHHIIGFYATTGRGGFGCKVLFHDRQEYPCVHWIFAMGTASPARRITGPERGVAYYFELPPVLILNFLHWLPRSDQDTSDILRFDTVAETFSMIPPPSIQVGNQNYPVRGRQLFEIDQHLAMAVKCPLSARVDVWVRSNTTELWSFRYLIRLPVDEIKLTGSRYDNVSVFAVAQDRNVLVCCPRILLHCDSLGTVLGRYRFTLLTGHTIQESLLLHPSILHALF